MTPLGWLLVSLPLIWIGLILFHALTFDQVKWDKMQAKWGPDSDWRTRPLNTDWAGPTFLAVVAGAVLTSIVLPFFLGLGTPVYILWGATAFSCISGFNIASGAAEKMRS